MTDYKATDAGKGDFNRTTDRAAYEANYDAIFNKEPKVEKPKTIGISWLNYLIDSDGFARWELTTPSCGCCSETYVVDSDTEDDYLEPDRSYDVRATMEEHIEDLEARLDKAKEALRQWDVRGMETYWRSPNV